MTRHKTKEFQSSLYTAHGGKIKRTNMAVLFW